MIIKKIKTEKLIPTDYNPTKELKSGDAEYEKLKCSIEEFGYVEPVIWNKTTGPLWSVCPVLPLLQLACRH